MVDLQDLEAIKRVKYKYMRCVDRKLWAEMEECFTEDATSGYSDGKYSFSGRANIIGWLRDAMNSPTVLSAHHVHHPEIDFTSATTARGVWAMEDTLIETGANITLRGAGFYEDEYVKVDGQWKIKHTGYKRTFEEVFSRADTPSLAITSNCWAKSGE
jgi:hypothetical protein